MKKLKVSIVNEHTLKLEEDGLKGDTVDLRDIINVDTNPILERIKNAKDEVYERELLKVKDRLLTEQTLKVKEAEEKLKLENEKLKHELESIKENVIKDAEIKYNETINKLKSEIELTKVNKDLEYNNKLNEKENQIQALTNNLKNEIERLSLNKDKEIMEVNNKHKDELRTLEDELANLRRERSSLTVKRIGEDLETWCDNEFNNQALAGFNNVSWQKDNDVIKGTKADFIYKVYANEEKNQNELLTSVILEMKSEDPLAPNKQSIDRMLKKLDNDRNNKTIEYAILVSEIGMDVSNDLPIKKVVEYEKMFIVRPEYFLTILNIITAFGMKYKDLLIAKEEQKLQFKDYEDILREFEGMKDEILDNSVKHINTQVDEIIKQSNNITIANQKILDAAELVLNRHLRTVENKLNDFKINRIIDKINNM